MSRRIRTPWGPLSLAFGLVGGALGICAFLYVTNPAQFWGAALVVLGMLGAAWAMHQLDASTRRMMALRDGPTCHYCIACMTPYSRYNVDGLCPDCDARPERVGVGA